MPQTDIGVLLFIGAIFFLIGLLGGGFEISAIKIPPVGKFPRTLSAGIGIIFMTIAIVRLISPPTPQKTAETPMLPLTTSLAVIPTETPKLSSKISIPLTDTSTPKPADISTPTKTSQPLTLTSTPTHISIPTVEVTEVVISPTPQITVQPTKDFPLAPEYLSIKGYSGAINSNGVSGTRKYSHLVTGKIKYNRVEADDDIKKAELVCENNQSIDITNQFYPIATPEGSIFPNYASNEIEIPANCRVDFTVIDTIVGQTGITINSIPVPATSSPTPTPYIKGYENIQPTGKRHISLADGELIVGTADRFQDDVNATDQPPCTAFVIIGPIEMDLTLWYGGWDYWANVYDKETAKIFLAQKVSELEQHQSCPSRGINQIIIP